MKAAVLLVTWLVYGQPPASYQVQFASMAACQQAQTKILAENAPLAAAEQERTVQMEAWDRVHGGFYNPGIPPRVSAVCASQTAAPTNDPFADLPPLPGQVSH